ncbi:sigma-70 family RNA polymerase sigma factor [Clostridia bacterium]|nr:sigma-70 family RNA polymerase sigma factor [Clostridia bacterium]
MVSDVELIGKFNDGDVDAFEQLIIRYEKKIYSICFYFLKNREDAEDAAQEIILKLYKKLGSFRQEAAFSTWMNYVASNTCRDYLRKRKRNKVLHLDDDIQTEDGQISRELPSEESTPEERIENKELGVLMQDTIAKLKEDHREILLMREYQELSYEEIAKILEISVGTVKSRIYRARKDLKALLNQGEQLQGYIRQKDS